MSHQFFLRDITLTEFAEELRRGAILRVHVNERGSETIDRTYIYTMHHAGANVNIGMTTDIELDLLDYIYKRRRRIRL